jgi:hypothetical protein
LAADSVEGNRGGQSLGLQLGGVDSGLA